MYAPHAIFVYVLLAPLGCLQNVQDPATVHGRCDGLQAQHVEIKSTGKSESESEPIRRTHLSIATNESDNTIESVVVEYLT